MSEPQITALPLAQNSERPWPTAVWHTATASFARVGAWSVDTAQQFGSLVAALMGPAVLSAYAFAAWSLTASLGWTASFPYSSGPLSNWLIWAAIASAVHVCAHILVRSTRSEKH